MSSLNTTNFSGNFPPFENSTVVFSSSNSVETISSLVEKIQRNGTFRAADTLQLFNQVMFCMKLLQLLIGFFGNALSLTVLLLYRHFLAHPFWFYLVALCTVDLFGCASFLIEMDEPIDFYHTFLYKYINIQLEIWILNMIRDLSAWLIVFIAIERWKSVCWNTDRPHHNQYSQHYQNHSQWSPPQRSNRQISTATTTTTLSSAVPPRQPTGMFSFASFKRRTAQLETFFIVAGALMIVNAINYFANENLWGSPSKLANFYSASNKNDTSNRSTTPFVMPYQQPPRAMLTESYLAEQWNKAWPFLEEIKQCWLPAVILLVLNCWIVVHTIRFLWDPAPVHLITGRRLTGFRRLTSTSISSPAPVQTATTTGSTSPLSAAGQPLQPEQNQAPASITRHRSQSLRRRRLVFAWLTLLALPTIFIAFTLPLSVYNILDELHIFPVTKDTITSFMIRDGILHWLADCNHTINCFIYCLTIAKFRLAMYRIFFWFHCKIARCIAILRKKDTNGDAEHNEQQCELAMFMEEARRIRQNQHAKKRRFVVGVVENVEAISNFQHQRRLASLLGVRRVSAMESGIAFDGNAHFHD